MKYCHNCGTKLEDAARFCSGCGAEQATGVRPQPESVKEATQEEPAPARKAKPAEKAENTSRPSALRQIATVLALVFACGICGLVFAIGGGESDPGAWRAREDKAGAYVMTKQYVEERLRAPGSAEWPWYSGERVTHLGGQVYRVDSYVDAQNAFGASVRNHFVAEIEKVGAERWQLRSLQFEE